jgi:hypothetical protein
MLVFNEQTDAFFNERAFLFSQREIEEYVLFKELCSMLIPRKQKPYLPIRPYLHAVKRKFYGANNHKQRPYKSLGRSAA